ncbi:unnamed protein product [Durusdinium trenchii]|uniref:carnosine N-methyltransferase n=1 Tax=Durusdinium trenchii TaxID=1381693 RepID=A0ABP0PP11_9DINO
MVGTASFKKVAHFLRPWHWGSIAVISLSAACVLLRRNPKPMSARVEGWRLSRSELREVLKKYEKLVAKDARALQHSSTARNQRLVEQLLDDLPDDSCDRTALVSENRSEVCTPPARPVAEFRSLGNSLATVSRAYGTLQSVFAHLMRDWSGISEQTVISNQYGQLLEEVKPHLPRGSHVLVPGAGLGRLALMLAGEGFQVEANDASALFMTFADYILNRAPLATPFFPLAHAFWENWGLEQQYTELTVPNVSPRSVANSSGPVEGSQAPVVVVPGDFLRTYQTGGPGFRQFDAVVTCFFIDMSKDVEELFGVLDSLLDVGGLWVNLGPLNWKKDSKLKLTWEEIVAIWQLKGYEFLAQKRVDTDYHIPRGKKMYTESRTVSLSVAVKRSKQ